MAVLLGLCGAQPAAAQENFSDKPAPQLFASDCTGSGCHKSPQGLAQGRSQLGLAGFLREHYTNSRQSASALASYLAKLPSTSARREAKPQRPATPSARSSRAAARSDDDAPAGADSAKPGAASRAPRQQATVAVPAPPVPPAPPAAAAAPEPAAAAPPKKKTFDIFD